MNAKLVEGSYIYINDFVTHIRSSKLARCYLSDVEKEGFTSERDVRNCPTAYNYPPFLHLLCEKTELVSNLFGSPVIPTYVYGRAYNSGSNLPTHTDREASEVIVSVNLQKDTPWPLYIGKQDGGAEAVELGVGDGVMFMGCKTRHWREPYHGKKPYIQVSLNYVALEGQNMKHYFDRIHFATELLKHKESKKV